MPVAPVITDHTGVADLSERCRATGRFALDFEFLWERTYRPVPCLAQVAWDDEIALVDPIAGADLTPLAALVDDPAVTTIMHAPSADLTLMALHYGTQPTNLTDVQLTAGFVGFGAGQSLATLLERALGVRLTKAESYSDWKRRPLTDAQLDYAADDVRYLLSLADELDATATRLGRTEWVAQEHALRYGAEARFTTDPDEAWRRIKGQGRLSPGERAVLREVAKWREEEALRRDRPPSWILQDRLAIDIARRRPRDRDALSRVRGLDERMRDREADSLLEAVGRGVAAEPLPLPPAPRSELAARLDVLVSLGQLVVAVRAEAAGLAAPLLATRDEIEAYMAGCVTGEDPVDSPLAAGWRRELAGEALASLAAGNLALAPSPRRPYLLEIDQRAS